MSLYEYDEERHMRQEREASREEGIKEGRKEGIKEGRKEGIREGIKEGRIQGQQRINNLFSRLVQDNRMKDLERSVQDPQYQEKLLKEYGL